MANDRTAARRLQRETGLRYMVCLMLVRKCDAAAREIKKAQPGLTWSEALYEAARPLVKQGG